MSRTFCWKVIQAINHIRMLWIGHRQGGLGSSRIARIVVRATVKGNIAVAAIQGTLGREGLAKLIFTSLIRIAA
ncbi:hypothetical protein SAMN05216412_101366 [Nitrosospira multiformis]|uniref:Uncharacterized protein n=1 Tax=Nitrosospira multiformis TaxID=1231 RepID=A0A1H9YSP7_9PROT|nr:hypothetical protein [Nitrosospira multiformis]SES72190.1 hypothetical protein SAMN05216412_101366 [Nitrosospira multiformis]